MSLPTLLATLIPEIVESGVEIFSKKFQTDGERRQAEFQFELALKEQLQNAWDAEQSNLTQRHANDMTSDSWLSKNIRPLTLTYLMALFTIAFFAEVPDKVMSLLGELLMVAFAFYFGARSFEKIAKIVRSK